MFPALKMNSETSREINSILVNDLNIIASKLDEIPETSLNIKLVLLAYECNDVKLNWKIQTPRNSKKFKFSEDNDEDGAGGVSSGGFSSSQIFGFQIVVREFLDSANSASGKNKKF